MQEVYSRVWRASSALFGEGSGCSQLARDVPDVGDRGPADLRRWRHAPADQDQLALGAGVTYDGRGIIWKHARHGLQISDIAVHDAEEGGDRALIGGN